MDVKLHISFEFFSVKTQHGLEKVHAMCTELARYEPEFYSVTYGAGGSTRSSTHDLAISLQRAGFETAPHLSFGSDDQADIIALLSTYKAEGISNLVALRGDLPSGLGGTKSLVHANELVALTRQSFGTHFDINVAAYPEIHPESESYHSDLYWLGEKLRAGANRAITQYFFNADAYFRFIEEAQKVGIDAPVIPGIMPITNFLNLVRFSDNCGAEIPRWLRWQLKQRSADSEDLIRFGIDVVTQLCSRLIEGGAPGLHFYTMNNLAVTNELCQNLSLPRQL